MSGQWTKLGGQETVRKCEEINELRETLCAYGLACRLRTFSGLIAAKKKRQAILNEGQKLKTAKKVASQNPSSSSSFADQIDSAMFHGRTIFYVCPRLCWPSVRNPLMDH